MKIDKKYRPRLPKFKPVAVIDIGSNSVRLVVYDGLKRSASPVFNEKVLCGLGRGVAATGMLSADGVERALVALRRFRAMSKQIGVQKFFAIATAAAREAKNGKDFVRRAEQALGERIRVLTGREEARYAALGVISSIPDADGVVGDLGGGSLELVDIRDGKILKGVTLPLGPFRLMDSMAAENRPANDIIEDALKESGMLERLKGRNFYAVGGAWRNLAKLQMRQSGHPLSVLQQHTLTATAMRSVTILVSGMEPDELRDIDQLSKKRSDTLPYSAKVLDRVLALGKPEKVVFSVYGVREGVLYNSLKPSKREHDPLLAGCWDFARRYARSPKHAFELCDWTDQLFAAKKFGETTEERRLRHGACLLADLGWRAYPDYRGTRSLNLITQAAIVGVDHPSRIFLALTILFRYEGPNLAIAPAELTELLNGSLLQRAREIAVALRLAYALTGAMPGLLPKISIEMASGKTLRLSLPKKHADLSGEVVEKRLGQLADTIGAKSELEIG